MQQPRKQIGFLVAFLAALSIQANAETLAQYVSACKASLGFTTLPAMNCNNGALFAPTSGQRDPTNDYVISAKVNDSVDVTAACRWLGNNLSSKNGTFPTAQSIEMLVHNRRNGQTCFFDAKPQTVTLPDGTTASGVVPTSIVAPTATNAGTYWHDPADLDVDPIPDYDFDGIVPRCVTCHSEGPYIASPRIASSLSRFGLLNNGHETFGINYHTPGSTFANWENLARQYQTGGCSASCHTIGIGQQPPQVDVVFGGTILLPSITSVYTFIGDAMPPTQYDSHYRWINLDTAGDGVESENFVDAKSSSVPAVPYVALPDNCPTGNVPTDMEAHATGVDPANAFSYSQVSWITEKLRSFNLKDGLVCMNADQDPGVVCRDWDVSYMCPNGTWTGFFNHTVNAGGGDDHEERSASNSQILAACKNQQPMGIKARVYVDARGGKVPQYVNGPNDRLARFSQYGLTCNTADQPDGQCSNYVVRYQGCAPKPPVNLTQHLTNVLTGKQLTATSASPNALAKGQPASGWNTQQWNIEPVKNTEYVRLKNVGTNNYLNAPSQGDPSTVVTSASSSATSQMWIVEPVTFSGDVRLKNLSTGKYLTVGDSSQFEPIYAQGKNPGWTSQRWAVN